MSTEYSLLPLPTVIKLVASLEDLRLSLFHSIEPLTLNNQPPTDYLLSIIRQTDNYARYLIFITPRVTENTIASLGDTLVRVIGVNYAPDGTLLQSYLMPNTVTVPLTILRSQVQLYWRSVYYTFTYTVPDVDRMREIKQSLLNIFVFPSLTQILYGKLVVHYTFVEQFFVPTYFGILNHTDTIVESVTQWDWSDGSLIGTFDSQTIYLWNTNFFAITNQYPDLKYSPNQRVVIGGNANYYFENRRVLTTDSILVKSSYSHQLAMQANELVGEQIDFITLKEYVLINNTNKYIIAFSNVLSQSDFDPYALLGSANFLDTDSTLSTLACSVVFVYNKDPSYQQYGVNFFFLYDAPSDTLYIYEPTFQDFLKQQSGRIVLSDLRTVPSTSDRSSFHNSRNVERQYKDAPGATLFETVTDKSSRQYNAIDPSPTRTNTIGRHNYPAAAGMVQKLVGEGKRERI